MTHLVRYAAITFALVLAPDTIRAAEAPASQPAAAFKGAYMHLEQMLAKAPDAAGRRETLAKELDRFKAAGLRVAMPYVKDTGGGALYESSVVPVRRQPDWDALGVFMEEAHKRGLQVWPVICVVPSGGESAPAAILNEHPDWALLDKKGKPIGYTSPCNPKAREWMASMVTEVAQRYRPEGLLLDYLRFPSQTVQFDPLGQAEFEKRYADHASASEAEKKQHVQAFKEQSLTELARIISREARRVRPGIRIGIYSWGAHVTRSHNVAQDWPTWVSKGYVDMVNVSGYCYRDNYGDAYLKTFADRMKDAAALMKQAGGSAELSFALGVKTSHGQVHNATEIGEYLRIARSAGVNGFAFFTWSYLRPYLDEVLQAQYMQPK